ncbi:related to HD family hydrolase [Rhynchosporium agropyri]|uniref:5'-deoxynucleotidase n=1 Tax=Rhynchosporium agropyri TaxID=914238 RepID=A0A1E1LQ36_9HELO|nr:related to HD family hydrolase [Rhynchosporium agropyri]
MTTSSEIKTEGDTAPTANAQDATPWTVEAVVATLPGGPPSTDSTSPVPFFHLVERLKTTKREGWRRFGISQYALHLQQLASRSRKGKLTFCRGESISDHMYRMSIITMLAPPSLSSKLNIPHCTKMALVHDMAEALVGDITPVDGVSKPEKNRRESTTMDYLTKSLLGKVHGGVNGQEIQAVWQEYEDSVTPEAMFVHDVDKIELILQMVEYERVNERRLDLGEFSWVATRIVMPEVKEWSDELLKEREDFWAGKEHTTWSDAGVEVKKGSLEYYSKPGEKIDGTT